ncbi:MAG TPA: hypothetical protein VNG33_06745, partial [Polyangiaceae bacterium]|nr:hypothetical protein [Polyangiaceae bacterium]
FWAYYVERMDDRIWVDADDVWCVDCGLAYGQLTPNANLTASSARGDGSIGAYNVIFGGSGYTNPTARIVAPEGSGAEPIFQLSGGAIIGATAFFQGSGYFSGAQVAISDDTGSGAVVEPLIYQRATFTADAPVFASTRVGDVIRMDNCVASVVQLLDAYRVLGQFVEPITDTVPNDPFATPKVATAGNWRISTPTTVVHGLDHLEGMEVSILADGGTGQILRNITVRNGQVNLLIPASLIVVGLPYTVQVQTMYLEPPSATTTQGRRKNIYNLTVRVVGSRGWQAGANQPDASTQPYGATVPWTNMVEIPERGPTLPPGNFIPLTTGDRFTDITAGWANNGQIAIQQENPLPLQLVALVANLEVGDSVSADE